jgi:glycosyltransferase involved in cell wall biosynthesis
VNILYITAYDAVGQHFNGYLLHKAFRARGHNSQMVVAQSRFDEPEIHELGSRFSKSIDSVIARIERELSFHSILPISALSLYYAPYYRTADIVHLQLLHASPFFSLLNIPPMSQQHRLVWTIHDPWLMSGHCVHSLDCDRWLTGCGRCPDLGLPIPIKRDTSAFSWKLKRWLMHRSDISLIVASQWMKERVCRSPILSHLPCVVIPFGINAKVFKPRDQAESRARFGIPHDANVLAFRWTPNFVLKGTSQIEKALHLLKPVKPLYLLTFDDKCSISALKNKYHFIELGWVDDPRQIALALSAADLFLMPSIAESFGMMAVESMACGTPVIVFEGTSLPSVIDAPRGGIAVPYMDHEALAQAIKTLLNNGALRQSLVENGLRIVQQRYTLDSYVRRHLELYEGLLSRPR